MDQGLGCTRESDPLGSREQIGGDLFESLGREMTGAVGFAVEGSKAQTIDR
jgi:hypothetical protein